MGGRFLILALGIASLSFQRAAADEFRYVHEETDGLTELVYDAKGKQTHVNIAKDSNPEALAIFEAVTNKPDAYIYGTRAKKTTRGAVWEQGIILIGDFSSPVKMTPYRKNDFPPEPYRDFKISDIKILFPFAAWTVFDSKDPLGPSVMQIHFSFDTLLPEGVVLKGKKIDLEKHAVGPPDSE